MNVREHCSMLSRVCDFLAAYQTQLQMKMNQLLEVFDNEIFQSKVTRNGLKFPAFIDLLFCILKVWFLI